ncbi:hypothetical protein RHMOL_Rhmol13G0300200 [Rhododendron molle]|uniref:Uncharacterized protein n=1 Tax=Rhododendron molle TaxID=49168 RepID=A0ACC0LC36_RHOML|nr:hypothetical protein RHMOL_Rhmol13G0300200 [Rhododendron molle]
MEDFKNLEVETDSQIATQLLSAVNIDNHPLSNIIFDCRSLIRQFDNINIKHIFREANRCADALAADKPISVGSLYFYISVPICISNLLYADYLGISYPRHMLM